MLENFDNETLIDAEIHTEHEVELNVDRSATYYSPLVKDSVTCTGYDDNGLPVLNIQIDAEDMESDEISDLVDQCIEYGVFAFQRTIH